REQSSVGTLLSVLDNTTTPMGGRLLKFWLGHPLANEPQIKARLDSVEFFFKSRSLRQSARDILERSSDLDRLLSRLSLGVGTPRDLLSLASFIGMSLEIKDLLKEESTALISELISQINSNLKDLYLLVQATIVEDPPIDPKSGGVIQAGVNTSLDELRQSLSSNHSWLIEFEKTERVRTGIGSLKVRYNKVFGYYIEISNANLSLVPKDYLRKQTMVNAERFITKELKEKETIVLQAEETVQELEHSIFLNMVEGVLKNITLLQNMSNAIAQLDCLLSFAHLAAKKNYVRPDINTSGVVDIKDGRHPVVETLLDEIAFCPNDTYLDYKTQQLMLITGPNMAGKSVYIRQVALIVLLAHLGGFVPASFANISLMDRIFVRSGASDIITQGMSTFMVEMSEAAYILNHATKDSLIILDELGRGTSTYDGISLASAIAEHLVSNYGSFGPKTLFATHYHELQELEKKYKNIKNYQVLVNQTPSGPVFLHKVIVGGAPHSFGIEVARKAGIPASIIDKAVEILKVWESR
ncbi:DNA mismatch repair protein MutS, partial [Patescibacteria group bacterium]|nr:DNA mismatch repair protein MutS [Patescibacteria group bacterium]